MKYLIPAVLLLLSSCATPAPGSPKVDVVLHNTSPYPIEIRASAGLFGRTLRLMPGESWEGWIPGNVRIRRIDIVVSDLKTTR